MQGKIIKDLLEIIKDKNTLNSEIWVQMYGEEKIAPWLKSETYLDAIIWEVEESKEEHKKNNSVYLEDELGDILWTYLNSIYFLEKEGLIDMDQVFKRCIKKYTQRTNGMRDGISWYDIKDIQKEELKKEHNKKYNA